MKLTGQSAAQLWWQAVYSARGAASAARSAAGAFLALAGCMALCTVLWGMAWAGLSGGAAGLAQLSSRAEMAFFVEENATDWQRSALEQELGRLATLGSVASWREVLSADAWDTLRENYPQHAATFQRLGEERPPFGSVFFVLPTGSAAAEKIEVMLASPRWSGTLSEQYIQQAAPQRAQAIAFLKEIETAKRLAVVLAVLAVGIAIGACLCAVLAARHARRPEARLMAQMGAPTLFLGFSIWLEGAMAAAVGAAAGSAAWALLTRAFLAILGEASAIPTLLLSGVGALQLAITSFALLCILLALCSAVPLAKRYS